MAAEQDLAPRSSQRGHPLRFAALAAAVPLALGALAVAVWPRASPDQLRREAVMAARAGHWEQAEAALARVRDPTPTDWLLRAEVAHSLQRDEEALADLTHAPRDGPLAAQAALVVGKIEHRRFHARAMEAALREALRLDPGLIAARRLLVYLYGTQERRAELMEQFAAMAEQGPLTFDLVYHWCLSRGEIGEPAEAKADLERFVANDPADRSSRLALAAVYRKLNQLDRAAATLAPLPDSDPDARAARAQLALERGDNQAAEALLSGGPQDHPALARLRGRLALARRDGPAAVRFFRKADAAEPGDRDTLFGLGYALRLAGEGAAAESTLRRATEHQTLRNLLVSVADKPDQKPEMLCKLAEACEAVGRAPEARAWYRLAIAADPLYREAQMGLFRLASDDTAARTISTRRGPTHP
jgi:tetratricopeptide (TPR) repeat protein